MGTPVRNQLKALAAPDPSTCLCGGKTEVLHYDHLLDFARDYLRQVMTSIGRRNRFAYVWGGEAYRFFPLLIVRPEWLCRHCNAPDGDLKKRGWHGIDRPVSGKYLTLPGATMMSLRLLRGSRRRAEAAAEHGRVKQAHVAAMRNITRLARKVAVL